MGKLDKKTQTESWRLRLEHLENIAQINIVFICAPNNKGSTEEGLLTWSKKINGQNWG